MAPVYLVMDEQEEQHDQPWPSYHIETPKRLQVIHEKLKETGLINDPRIEHIARREASEEEILLVHTRRYVDDVKSTEIMNAEQQEAFCTKYEDIYVNNATWRRAKLAAASSIDLVSSVLASKSAGIAFIRPPGHHAMPDAGCGFCIFNNVAIAARNAIKNGLARKVMIVDYDVHAGNGTQECVEDSEGNVKLISIHRYEHGTFWPNMPQTGIYQNYNNTMNLPLNTIGHTDSDYVALFSQVILPSVYSFQPDLLIVSSGFDAALGDPEGYMNVSPAGFATMIRMLQNTGIPVAAILEGGYFLEALAADSEWVLRALLGEPIPEIHVDKINLAITDTISRIYARYESKSAFFRKVQELRTILGRDTHKEVEEVDYKGVRTVKAPYETRGIYTPFSEEKVNGFKNQLSEMLGEYKHQKPLEKTSDDFLVVSEIDNYLGFENGKLLVGKNAKLFAELVFIAPNYPNYVVGPDSIDFENIKLDLSLKKIENVELFANLPIFYL